MARILKLLRAFHGAGMIRPHVPAPSLLPSLLRMPFRPRSLATAVTVHATLRGEEIAVNDDHGDTSWRDLHERANRLGHLLLRLQAEQGGDRRRVAILLRNGCPFVLATIACARVGLDGAPMNTWARAEEIRHILDTQRPFALLVDAHTAPLLEGLDLDLPVLLAGPTPQGPPPGTRPLEPLLAECPATLPPTREGARIVMHTSGTTGLPKGAERQVDGDSLDTVVRFLQKVPLRQDDVFALAPPLFHTLAWGMMAIGLVLGCRLVVRERFDAAAFARVLREQDATALTMVPVMVRRLLDQPDDALPTGLRILVTSGAPMTQPLRDRVRERLGDVHHDLYGSTETGWATIATPAEMKERPGTVGRPGDDMIVRILDEDGQEVPTGETGRVFMGTGWEFEGYTGRGNDRDRVGGLLTVGDVGHVDAEGWLYLSGRADDMIIRGGENIYPGEVEVVLERHPDLAESVVVGVPDEELGEALRAVVVPRAGTPLDADTLRAWLDERLPRWKVPRDIVLAEALPRNAAGKVLRRQLRDEAGA
ncbi:MAG: hypothetical protein EA398_00240 [Deltaproteobacteria bacterium]|nr:MAG: hypothetical protein EA398_00240 [Deltaproteobacteria bacterium]